MLYFFTKDYSNYFAERKGTLIRHEFDTVSSDSLFEKSFVTLQSSTGLSVECGMLIPVQKGKRHPAVILIGGKATGKHAIDYAVDTRNIILIAPDYPYEPREKYTPLQILADIPKVRRAMLDMVPSVMLVMDYLRGRDDVDTSKTILLGYSFGAPFVPSIVAHDRRVAVAAIVYGGGGLRSLIAHNVRRYEGPLLSHLVGILGCILLRPLEPMRYVDRISPTPLIMINGVDDEQIPRENVEMLYNKAGQPKKIIWLESMHVRPQNVELTKTIVRKLREELAQMKVLE
jgi:dienelactone hydrolase